MVFFKFILSRISEFCFQWCYKKCSELAGNQMQVIKKKLWDVACNIHYMDSQSTTKSVSHLSTFHFVSNIRANI